MKKKANPAPQAENDEPLYLRKAGDKVNGAYPYMAFDASETRTVIVRASDRDMEKYKVWQALGKYAKFWR